MPRQPSRARSAYGAAGLLSPSQDALPSGFTQSQGADSQGAGFAAAAYGYAYSGAYGTQDNTYGGASQQSRAGALPTRRMGFDGSQQPATQPATQPGTRG